MHISKLVYSIFCISLSLGAVDSDSLTHLNNDRIACKQELVRVQIVRNYWEKMAFYAVIGSAVGGTAYYMWPDSQSPETIVVDKKTFGELLAYAQQGVKNSEKALEVVDQVGKVEPVVIDQATEVQQGIFRSLFNSSKNMVTGIWGAGKDFVVWSAKTGWQGAVSSFMFHHMIALSRFPDRYLDPLKGIGTRFEDGVVSVYNRLFFQPTLQWYVQTQTHLKDLFFDLYTRAFTLEYHQISRNVKESQINFIPDETLLNICEVEYEDITDAEVSLYFERFAASWDACIKDIEGLIGFLQFKASSISAYQDEYSKTCAALREIVTQCTDDIESRYKIHKNRTEKIESLTQKIKKFTRLLQAECDSCIIFEQAYA